jgi:hypothetical protein
MKLAVNALSLCFLLLLSLDAINAFRMAYSPSSSQRLLALPQENEMKMSIDELTSELELRKVNYDDCVSKKELAAKLTQSRLEGRADPSIIDNFNKNIATEKIDLDDIDINSPTAKDGALPGGLPPEMMKAMSSDPEIMQMLRDPKMQVMFLCRNYFAPFPPVSSSPLFPPPAGYDEDDDGRRPGVHEQGNFLLIYICNFHVLNNFLMIFICKLHWNLMN